MAGSVRRQQPADLPTGDAAARPAGEPHRLHPRARCRGSGGDGGAVHRAGRVRPAVRPRRPARRGCGPGVTDAGSLVLAALASFGLAWLSAVAGFGGGVLLLPVFTALFGLRTAIPALTLTQLASNGSRVWLNRRHLRWPIIGRFALGAVPFALAGGLLLAVA